MFAPVSILTIHSLSWSRVQPIPTPAEVIVSANQILYSASFTKRQVSREAVNIIINKRKRKHQPNIKLDYSWLSQHPLLWFCQEPWIHSWLKTVHEEARHKKSDKLLISSLNALVQSAGFSLTTQSRHLLLPISFHGLTTATVSSWVHLILSSSLSRKFRTLLQDLFTWHPVTSPGKTALASHFRTY